MPDASPQDESAAPPNLETFVASYDQFGETLARLQTAYDSLEAKFDTLNTELEAANHKLRDTLDERNRLNAHLTGVLENLSCGVVAVDADGRITLINPAAAELLGYDPARANGEDADAILGDAAHALDLTRVSREPVPEQERELHRKDGRAVPVRFSTVPLGQDVDGAIAVFEDVSQLRDLAKQASRISALTALGEMSATVAHEIRNPLGGIGGFAALLQRDLEVDDPRRRLVNRIIDGVDSLNRIVSDLLTYTRPVQLNLRPTNFIDVVEDCLGFFEIDAGARAEEIEVVREYAREEVPCRIDPEQVQQVFLNLLHNAVQAIPGTGRIHVGVFCLEPDGTTLSDTGPRAVLRVADSGIGMDEETIGKLFRPFFTTKEDGNGLGLATARKVIEAHGGDITVQSRLHEGTEFTVYLPA